MRLEPLRKVDLSGEQRDLYDALVSKSVGRDESFVLDEQGAVRGPIVVLLRHPTSGRPLQELAAGLRFGGLLPDQAREAVILVVAADWDDADEWSRHVVIARDAGMAGAQLAAIRRAEDATFDDPITQSADDAARAIRYEDDLTDEDYARLHGVLGDELLVEVTVLIGYYALLSMQMRVFRISGPIAD